ncbi:hypothetical protein BDV06DRAFT_207457 [Aspergillus oleicola]
MFPSRITLYYSQAMNASPWPSVYGIAHKIIYILYIFAQEMFHARLSVMRDWP